MEFTNINEEMSYIKKRNAFIKEFELFWEDRRYTKVDINYFEPYEEFIEQNKRIKKASMIKIMKPDGNLAILRPDITTNIIKQVVNKWVKDTKLKLYYDANIFRQGSQGLESIRQFGLEQLGYDASIAEQEVLNAVTGFLERYQINYKIRLGSSALINSLFDALSWDKVFVNQVKNAVQAKDQASLDKLLTTKERSIEASFLQKILSFEGSPSGVFKNLESIDLPKGVSKAIKDLELLINDLEDKTGLWVDLSLIPEYDYYNGLVLEGYTKGLSTPLFQGGRYDSLTKQFGQNINAFGVSFDFQALIQEVVKND